MRDVRQFPVCDLSAPHLEPMVKSFRCQLRTSPNRPLNEMQDELQKIFFIFRVASVRGIHDPI